LGFGPKDFAQIHHLVCNDTLEELAFSLQIGRFNGLFAEKPNSSVPGILLMD